MIPNHERFLEAILEKRKVCVRFYSRADNGVLDRVCAPLDYGPGNETEDGLNRYWLWNYGNSPGPRTLGLAPQHILDVQVLGESFDPAGLEFELPHWSVPRDWGLQPKPSDAPIAEFSSNRPESARPFSLPRQNR